MKIDIETLKGLDPTKVYVIEVKNKRMIEPARDAFVQLGINVLVTTKGSIKFIEPKQRTGSGVSRNPPPKNPLPKKVIPMPPPDIENVATIRKGLDKAPKEK